MPIRSSDGEIIGVAQAINKIPEGTPFTEDDEKVRFHAFCDFHSPSWLLIVILPEKDRNCVNSCWISPFVNQRAFSHVIQNVMGAFYILQNVV